MAYRPNGVPVTNVQGLPMVGYNGMQMGQPVTMMMQPTMIQLPMRTMGHQMTMVRPMATNMGPQIVGQAIQQSEGPPVTIFVGNISEKATDTLVRQILMKCGTVNNWKRIQGANNTLQAFGFCEFKEPDSALRALRLLQGYQLANKQLLVKVDDNAQTIIEQWKKRVGVVQDSDGMDVLSPQVKNRDESVRGDLKTLLKEYATDLFVDSDEEEEKIKAEKVKETVEKSTRKKSEEREKKSRKETESKSESRKRRDDSKEKKEVSKEDFGEKKDIIVDQIEKFRESQKKQEEEKARKSDRSSRDRRESSKRERSVRSTDRERERRRRTSSRDVKSSSRRERSKERSRSKRVDRSKSRERSRDRRRRSEERKKDEFELLERRRLERKLKEKDSAYHERLGGWEAREKRKAREWARIEGRDAEIRKQMYKEAKRLRDFLENYDDERDDRKFYFGSGSAFQRRLESREKEKESDTKDRRKEVEEIGGLRKKLASEGHPDPDGAIAKVIKEAEEVWKPFITPEIRKRKHSRTSTSSESESSSESAPDSDDEPIDIHVRKKSSDQTRHHSSDEDEDGNDVEMEIDQHHTENENVRAPIRLPGLSSTTMSRNSPAANSPAFQSTFVQKESRSRKVASVFQDEDEEINHETAKKRKVTIPKEIKNAEEKRKAVKALIDRIPTDRGPLFAYPMVWENLTQDLMKNRISPWIHKKLHEIIGEDEPTLVSFITEKLEAEEKPENILSEIRVVLDDEADMFVIKLWRLLIYETEARREGITT